MYGMIFLTKQLSLNENGFMVLYFNMQLVCDKYIKYMSYGINKSKRFIHLTLNLLVFP